MKSILDAYQRALLGAVLDRIIPAGDGLPGAGEVGVGDSIERSMADAADLRRLILDGLSEIELRAHADTGTAFTELEPASQTAVLQAVERQSPRFFAALVEHTYRGYYVLPAVQRALGQERPPQPLGHTLPPFDPALLERQRARAPFWRPVADRESER